VHVKVCVAQSLRHIDGSIGTLCVRLAITARADAENSLADRFCNRREYLSLIRFRFLKLKLPRFGGRFGA
jgi:hypothetical protein